MSQFRSALLYVALGVIIGQVALPLMALLANAQTYVVATIASYHYDRDKSYNENNLGLGLEHRVNDDWSISTGFFRNSFDRHTNYLFAGYTPVEVAGWRTGVVMGAVTGYESGASPWLTGVAMRDFGRIGINLVFSGAAIAVQLKVKLE